MDIAQITCTSCFFYRNRTSFVWWTIQTNRGSESKGRERRGIPGTHIECSYSVILVLYKSFPQYTVTSHCKKFDSNWLLPAFCTTSNSACALRFHIRAVWTDQRPAAISTCTWGILLCLQVQFSMLEIYNEQVRDLLNPASLKVKGGLKVRQHPNKGFYGKDSLGTFMKLLRIL